MSAERIPELNDQFRMGLKGGQVVMTAGVRALPLSVLMVAAGKVATYAAFTPENDPRGEHASGSFEVVGEKIFWKIDAYNANITGGSEDPADPSTTRVLTIMLASEY